MLETTLKTQFAPGTNLTGGLACASWRFLLPRLQLTHILCVGMPARATMQVLAQQSEHLTLLTRDPRRMEFGTPAWGGAALPQFRLLAMPTQGRLPLPDKSVDLIVVAAESGWSELEQMRGWEEECGRLLSPQGTIYLEIRNWRRQRRARRMIQRWRRHGLTVARRYWITPFRGELRTAFPLGDETMTRHLLAQVLFGQSFKKRLLSHVGTWASRAGLLPACAPRRAVMLQRKDAAVPALQVPQYLHDLASQAGLDLSAYRCGLSARGKYNSNKTIFHLFKPGSTRADLVIKMTRAPEFNGRLENEYRVLQQLREQELVAGHTYPQPLFFGMQAGLAVMGQKAVHGEPFRRRTLATEACPLAHQVLNWMLELAARSAPDHTAPAAAAGTTLQKLYERFREIYPLSREESEFMAAQIELVARTTHAFPLVFQHGDPGTWNILVSPQHQVVIIDWEAGEPHGMPLWDLFYFMRSYGNWVARRQGIRDTLQGFARNFFEISGVGAMLIETVQQYCARINLPGALVAPLFYTCWMHRALKEATRLTAATLEQGHYFNLLRHCIAQRESAAMVALCS